MTIIIGHPSIVNHNIAHAKDIKHKTDHHKNINQLNQISNAHSQCLIQMQQQLIDNQKDIDILRGYIQDMQHHISEISNNQKKMESYQTINNTLNKKNDVSYHSGDVSNKSIVHSSKSKQQYSEINKSMIVDVDTAYKKAVSLVLEKKQYHQAIEAFQDFIKNYPESIYQSNSHYWLGQLYYNKGHKNNASYHFALVVKNYPKSLKAPDALLKIGIIMQETGEKDKSKTIYKQVGKLYPNSDAAKQAQKRLLNL